MKVILTNTLKDKNISQYRLSQLTGISIPTINKLCNNKTERITFDTLDKICKALNCEVSDILISDSNDNM